MTQIKKNPNYDDKVSREFIANIFEHLFNMILKNGKHKQIDLVVVDDEDVGVEVEHGHWDGDFWEDEQYSLISSTGSSGDLGFPTINIPIRKEKYWLDYINGIPNPSAELNMFVRTNDDFTQFIIIRPEVIRDPTKAIRTRFKPNNNDEEEDWLSFKREDVETYYLINGVFVRG